MKRLTSITLAAFVGAVGLAAPPAVAAGEADAEITYTKHIAPVIQRSCESCHRLGGFAPMSLMTYN